MILLTNEGKYKNNVHFILDFIQEALQLSFIVNSIFPKSDEVKPK